MKSKLALVVAIVLGAVAIIGILQYAEQTREEQREQYNPRYVAAAAQRLKAGTVIEMQMLDPRGNEVVELDPRESFVGSSIQFLLPGFSEGQIRAVLDGCAARGVELKWFGAEEPVAFTSRYDSWRYVPPQSLPRTDAILAGLMDMRLPLTFSTDDAALIAEIIRDEVQGAIRHAAE